MLINKSFVEFKMTFHFLIPYLFKLIGFHSFISFDFRYDKKVPATCEKFRQIATNPTAKLTSAFVRRIFGFPVEESEARRRSVTAVIPVVLGVDPAMRSFSAIS